jgi:hypothetical protein
MISDKNIVSEEVDPINDRFINHKNLLAVYFAPK